jgi:neutral ceramidase
MSFFGPIHSQYIFKRPAILLMLLCMLFNSFSGPAAADTTASFLVGRGMSDITGPSYGIPIWGFGRADQLAEGIHIRQQSRAFVVAQSAEPNKRVVFVSADLGSIEHHITLAVIEKLQQQYGDIYSIKNVILSATHTHAGPSGYWHSRSDLGLDGGFYPDHFNAIVSGIVKSINLAHNDLNVGSVFLAKEHLSNAGVNRSVIAYLQNPQRERNKYPRNTPTEMTLLKFMHGSENIGMINWYALHPTAMNFNNHLISGDHKGYASLQMESQRNSSNQGKKPFVAAFAQSDPGDVSPNTNLNNTGPGSTDVQTTKIMGERQLALAQKLFDQANIPLNGSIETRQVYVDLSDYQVTDEFTAAGPQTTCPSAYGYSFAGGSSEDGGGHFLFEEGMTKQSYFLDLLIGWLTKVPKWTAAVKECQSPKPILFETGSGEPPLQSQIRSITIARIGSLVIIALPVEVTTMAGRRLRMAIMDQLGNWAKHIVIAGYSNGYAGYVTTPEEYSIQQYEGGHTLHGRWTLAAYLQITSRLAKALETNTAVNSDSIYDDWRGKSSEKSLSRGDKTSLPEGLHYGSPKAQNKTQYRPGDLVIANFWSTNPTENYPEVDNYLLVEKKTSNGWQAVATDGSWETTISWHLNKKSFVATAQWQTSPMIANGTYRLTHLHSDAIISEHSVESQTIYID